jgi:hypothetical protein
LNEQERARQAARAKRDGEIAAALAELGISPAEASLFNVVHYGVTVPPADLCCRAAWWDYSLGGQVTEEQNEAALAGCLAKGWLLLLFQAIAVA